MASGGAVDHHDGAQPFTFGPHAIPPAHVFTTTPLSVRVRHKGGGVVRRNACPDLERHRPSHPSHPNASHPSHPFLSPPPSPLGRTNTQYAFVNLKPVVPGHVLVSPRRCSPRLAGLSPAEVTDLFSLAARVGAAVEPHYRASSLTLAVQDGPAAGQTVPHVHVHVLPRVGGDFPRNDDVYTELEKAANAPAGEGGRSGEGSAGAVAFGAAAAVAPDAPRPPRSDREMADEAAVLRTLF